jgi:signal transduction histidine kinase
VLDNRVGFSGSSTRRSFGLMIMHERAQSVKGELHIHSRPQAGTLIECRLPCLSAENMKKASTVLQ